jgi:hypothetical protein
MNKRGGLQMKLKSKKIAILWESDFYGNEIFYSSFALRKKVLRFIF